MNPDPGAGATPSPEPYPYSGPEALRQPILQALTRVVDPEVSLSIVDVGLIYGVTIADGRLHLLLTMTSAACPVTDLIIEEVETELDRVVPAELQIQVELTWEPPWHTDRMSERAKRFMQW
nr:metal-sulfur cluster assembly factor [uncultured Roseateles sp.]